MLGGKLSQTRQLNPPPSGHLATGAGTDPDSVAFNFGDARTYGHDLWSRVDTRVWPMFISRSRPWQKSLQNNDRPCENSENAFFRPTMIGQAMSQHKKTHVYLGFSHSLMNFCKKLLQPKAPIKCEFRPMAQKLSRLCENSVSGILARTRSR